jgi:NADH-quinone oxidoreductase subunit H
VNAFDQIFVTLKHWILNWPFWPDAWKPVVSVFLSIIPILIAFPLLFALTTVIERKGLGRIQNRYGPNRVGPCGFLQFAADGIKMLTKEDIVPRAADRVLHYLAPFILVVPVFLSYSVLPFGVNMVPVDLDAGILFFFAVGAATELSVFVAGWSSRNKYALLGAMRGIAQMISYELPLVISSLTVVMMSGTLSLATIVDQQAHYYSVGEALRSGASALSPGSFPQPQSYLAGGGWLPAWNVFTPWGLAGFVLFLIAAIAEANRSPFDLPEAESEIIAGYFVEYSGFKFALFFLGEYLGLFAVSGLAITLFLGGWSAPLGFGVLKLFPSWGWFFVKLLALLALFIWIRGTVPRLRVDQLMNFAWKFMLPMTLINLVVAAVWHFNADWNVLVRWAVCAALLIVPYFLFGRGFEARISKRVYRYAD